MNWIRCHFTRLRNTFRPRLEHLERRDCPSCSVFQKGETLFIVGDGSVNKIDIEGSRAGGISVSCDGSVAKEYAGVKQINLMAGGDDDEIEANFTDTPDPDFGLRADLGAGKQPIIRPIAGPRAVQRVPPHHLARVVKTHARFHGTLPLLQYRLASSTRSRSKRVASTISRPAWTEANNTCA